MLADQYPQVVARSFGQISAEICWLVKDNCFSRILNY